MCGYSCATITAPSIRISPNWTTCKLGRFGMVLCDDRSNQIKMHFLGNQEPMCRTQKIFPAESGMRRYLWLQQYLSSAVWCNGHRTYRRAVSLHSTASKTFNLELDRAIKKRIWPRLVWFLTTAVLHIPLQALFSSADKLRSTSTPPIYTPWP